MKRQGVSLPWSGTREATVSSVSSSAAARGRADKLDRLHRTRRVFSNSSGFGHALVSVARYAN